MANNVELLNLENKIPNRGDGMSIIKSPWKNEGDSESDSGFDWCSNSGCSVDSERIQVEKKAKNPTKYSWTGTFKKNKKTMSFSSERSTFSSETCLFGPLLVDTTTTTTSESLSLKSTNSQDNTQEFDNFCNDNQQIIVETKEDFDFAVSSSSLTVCNNFNIYNNLKKKI